MTLNPLPPQAYTKETMVKAFSWLHNQSKSIQELATTPDILVSLYLKAQMRGDSALDTPSITNFKAELKSLAGMMGEFESKQEPITATTPTTPAQMPKLETKAPTPSAAPQASMPMHTPAATYVSHQPLQQPQSHPQMTTSASSALPLDPRSLEMLASIQKEFNLSSDQEALRLLISVGFKKLTSI